MTSRSPSTSYNKLWALGSEHATAPPPADTLPASHNILEVLRKKRGTETAAWLNSLTHTNQTAAPAVLADTQSTENQQEHQLIQWLDALFDQFEIYGTRFNRTAQGTDLLVACTRPEKNGQVKEQPDQTAHQNSAEKTYQGDLATRYWAMLLRGTTGTITVYIIPAEVLLGFSLHKIDESVYRPLLVIESCWKDNQLTWHIGGTCITPDQIPLLAKELFGDLIRVASGQMSESELFAHPLQELSLGENLAVGYKMPPCASEELAAQSTGSVKATAPPANVSKDSSLTLASPDFSEKMLLSMEADIKQLFQLGKNALAAEETSTFKEIELLTEKMETLKETLKTAFAEIAKRAQSIQEKKDS